MSIRLSITSAAIIMALLLTLPATAQWSDDPTENTPVCTTEGDKGYAMGVEGGDGGAIFIWQDLSSATDSTVLAQRLDAKGTKLWNDDGVVVCSASGMRGWLQTVGDGTGGAFVTWTDERSGPDEWNIYAQRISPAGTMLWATDGVAVCTASGSQVEPQLTSDEAGGAIIVWKDYRDGSADIYAQRLDAAGTALWDPDGVSVCVLVSTASEVQIASDGSGGAIAVWSDSRWMSGGYVTGVYGQKMSSSGVMRWTVNGEPICTAQFTQREPKLVADGAGGAIVSWHDTRAGIGDEYDIYAQRVNSSGNALWLYDGIAVCTGPGDQRTPEMVSDDEGGAIICWSDFNSFRIQAQRVLDTGNTLWATNGIQVSATSEHQSWPYLVGDGDGGAVVSWIGYRYDDSGDIFAQRLDASGSRLWPAEDVPVCIVSGSQSQRPPISDGREGAIFNWIDYRSGSEYNIYAQRITGEGCLGSQGPFLTMADDVPGDQGGMVDLSWMPSCLDVSPRIVVTHYSVWRRIPDGGAILSGWSYVTEIAAGYLDEYTATVPAYGIYNGSGEIPWTDYMVVAHTADQWVFWESAVISGYSVDNLAPGAPIALTGTPSGMGIQLAWSASGHHDEDLDFYRVYRGHISGFTPDESTFIGTAAGTSYTDPAPGPGTWHYRVTGQDINGNEGLPSDEASAATSVTSTISASLTCTPPSGIVPFSSAMSVSLENLDQQRPATRIAGRIDIQLASGSSCIGWRQGWINVFSGGQYSVTWPQSFPSARAVIGNNTFALTATDVTPSPYNQPPFPPSGVTATATCTVTAHAQ